MRLIDGFLLDKLSGEAARLPRQRKNYNFHTSDADLLQRMLNAFEPGTYVRPHRHTTPPKREVFLVLRGCVAMVFFNNKGDVVDSVVLNASKGVFGVEVEVGEWHSVVSLQQGSVVYELKDGPYEPSTDKDFASWAPAEGSDGCADYLARLLSVCGLVVE
jgi:cupin fold WbuC family metalloprotein